MQKDNDLEFDIMDQSHKEDENQQISAHKCYLDEMSNYEKERQKIVFRKNLSYWIHPCLPGIPNFPLTQPLKPVAANICKDTLMQGEIMAHWVHSFQSVFTLVKCGYCPYFYMCCQKFIGLFIGANVAGLAEMGAIITPTTRGMRELWKKEGMQV